MWKVYEGGRKGFMIQDMGFFSFCGTAKVDLGSFLFKNDTGFWDVLKYLALTLFFESYSFNVFHEG